MKVRPLSYAIGAEITGVDLAEPLNDDQWAEIRAAWLQHIMLVFPGQKLSPEQLISFAGRFGPLDDHNEDPTYRLPGYPQIYRLGNYLVDGEMSKTKDTGRKWHSDHSYTTNPTLMSMLYCREAPPVGGTTGFANMYMAYEMLSPTMKKLLEDLEAVHDLLHFLTAPHLTWKPKVRNPASIRERFPSVIQPVVRVHPETGKKSLYVSEGYTREFVGLTQDEGRGLLDFLLQHVVTPEITYRHNYRPDDLVFWDNRCANHIALADYMHDNNNLRLMHRLTVLGSSFGRLLELERDSAAA